MDLAVEADSVEVVEADVSTAVRSRHIHLICLMLCFVVPSRGGRGGFQRDAGPPDTVLGTVRSSTYSSNCLTHEPFLEMGTFVHAVEDEMLCSSVMQDKVPYFNAPIYLQNKSVIGKVDEILGPINEVYFSVKMGDGMVASSFKKGDKVYIGGDKLLPIERFLPKPKVAGGSEYRKFSALSLKIDDLLSSKLVLIWIPPSF